MLLKFLSGDVGKTAVRKVLENYQKNVFSSVPFKQSNCLTHPSIIIEKLTQPQIFSLLVLRIIKLVSERLNRLSFK